MEKMEICIGIFLKFLEDYTNEEKGFLYNERVDEIRKIETNHLNGSVYLDYAGSGIYQKKQITGVSDLLLLELYGNTHSRTPSSIRSELKIKQMRNKILDFFETNENDYSVIFTSGATGALKLVAESFPWNENSLFAYSEENHNSVLGIRELAKKNGGRFSSFTDEEIESAFLEHSHEEIMKNEETKTNKSHQFNLFAFPAESNFSGKKYKLDWINTILGKKRKIPELNDNGEFYVLLDAAAFVPTNPLNLTLYPADFVSLSFYKMFGFPTGIGCLLVKNSVCGILKKNSYWGGGVVVVAGSDDGYRKFKMNVAEKFEDGTLNFLSIIALEFGFSALKEIGGMEKISAHVNILTKYAYDRLSSLKHSKDGSNVVEVYGDHYLQDIDNQGSILSFNVLKKNGKYVGHKKVMVMASRKDIHIRSGSHCNPGGMKRWMNWSTNMVRDFGGNEGGQTCASSSTSFFGSSSTGTVRASFGYLTTFEDVKIFLDFIEENFKT